MENAIGFGSFLLWEILFDFVDVKPYLLDNEMYFNIDAILIEPPVNFELIGLKFLSLKTGSILDRICLTIMHRN